MPLHFYNTLTRRKEEFNSLDERKVRMYTCGPTVYDFAHIGNYRTFIFEDLLRRYLEFRGYEVQHVMNITDVDDNTIRRSGEQGIALEELTETYIEAFHHDLKTLNAQPAHDYPRATRYIDGMVSMVQNLVDRGYAYVAEDGSVYFKIDEFSEYGQLARLNPDDMLSGERVADDSYEKEGIRDFVLWKGWKEGDGDVGWDSPWGKGRPGWHIECSVMSTELLGRHFDIHCGGVDNIFPHHENEIAQSRCATDGAFVNYWLHSEYLLVDNRKMSKSLNNFYTLRDVMDKGFSAAAVRWMLITTHYRQKLNFSLDRLDEAARSVERIQEFHERMLEYRADGPDAADDLVAACRTGFQKAMDDDLNISAGLAAVFDLIRQGNRLMDEQSLSRSGAKGILNLLHDFDHVLGILEMALSDEDPGEDSAWIEALIQERMEARSSKDFARADAIRDELHSKGIELIDTPDGTRWKRS